MASEIPSPAWRTTVLRTVLLSLFLAGLVLGLYARFTGLDRELLGVDEYYFVRSVQLILDSGIPEFPAGGYYTRGLIPQYLIAGSVSLFGMNAVALRLPVVLLGLLAVALAYLYARRFMDRPPALAVALTLLVSSWHVEFSLFVRMYMAFQCVTLLFLLAQDDAFRKGRWRWRYLPHVLAVGATIIHSLGVLLAPLLLIPLINWRDTGRFPTRAHRARFLAAGVLTILLCVYLSSDRARTWNVSNPLPAGYVSAHDQSEYWEPHTLLWHVTGENQTDLRIFLGLLAATAGGLALYRRLSGRITEADIVAALLLLSTAAHLFLLSLAFGAVLVVRYRIFGRDAPSRTARVLVGLAVVVACGWVAWAFASGQVDPTEPGLAGEARALRRLFFDWPQIFRAVTLPWRQELPITGLLLALALAFQFVTKARLPLREVLRQPACVALYIGLCYGVLRSLYVEIRYCFFIYPVLLCVIALTIDELVRRAATRWRWAGRDRAAYVAALAYLAVFAISDDFHPRHLTSMDDPDVVLRRPPYDRYRTIWYPRDDVASPAEFLNGLPDDPASRIVVCGVPPVSYYLGRDHAVFYDRSDLRFDNVARQGGTVDLWSDRPLLSTADDLRHYTQSASTVWLVQRADTPEQPFDPAAVWGARLGENTRADLGADGRIEVRRVTLN